MKDSICSARTSTCAQYLVCLEARPLKRGPRKTPGPGEANHRPPPPQLPDTPPVVPALAALDVGPPGFRASRQVPAHTATPWELPYRRGGVHAQLQRRAPLGGQGGHCIFVSATAAALTPRRPARLARTPRSSRSWPSGRCGSSSPPHGPATSSTRTSFNNVRCSAPPARHRVIPRLVLSQPQELANWPIRGFLRTAILGGGLANQLKYTHGELVERIVSISRTATDMICRAIRSCSIPAMACWMPCSRAIFWMDHWRPRK